jgi:hypothetical protein
MKASSNTLPPATKADDRSLDAIVRAHDASGLGGGQRHTGRMEESSSG